MWNLKKPDVSRVRDDLDTVFPDDQAGLVVGSVQKDVIERLYNEYIQANGRPNSAWLQGGLSKSVREALLEAYGQVSDTGKLSTLRSALKLSVNECPYCGFGEIKDLDHHLQKAHYNCFSIFPLNLVPACSKCNGHKPRKPRSDPNKHHLHAYLEDVSKHRFLVAAVTIKGKAMSVEFKIKRSAGMNRELKARLEQHLDDFHLNDRYPAQVNIFLSEQKTGIEMAYEYGGAKGLRMFLERSAAADEDVFGKNDWRAALLLALAKCKPFCKGGFYKVLGY
ncbi:HNH endonuclease signature motif containing protein [Burkholderia sp. BCC1988]|uniref:HNH endonuclease signature motif containing protein n=1 Tax=Burkholderia sp. BCC1988 TaxID=2817443 RepID=UPI002AB2FF00|nr:HNH endonuclease signature motif containing protein [Burkholderia sp. BCC1988]